MKIAIIEPYYGGSHKSFWDTLVEILPYEFQLHTLPARKWKWRMRLAAPFFAKQFQADPDKLHGVSIILCSPYLDVAAFKGLLPQKLQGIPVFTYFHENQFTYPVQIFDERDLHFALTNLTTALASDRLAFNSKYNYQSFVDGAEKLLDKIYDMSLSDWKDIIQAKSVILHPGIDFTELDQIEPEGKVKTPVILWNHRWEHDKNPQLFFETLAQLEQKGHDFKIIVLGESFQLVPEIFSQAREELKEKIIQFGYVQSRQEYLFYLKKGDIVVSTAAHEFYGISVIEAVRAGCLPLVPDALSYPELLPQEYLYKEGELLEKLTVLLTQMSFSAETGKRLTEQFSWPTLLPQYQKWIEDDSL